MSTPLANKVTLVTGASRGIGQAIAESQTANGANVVINYAHNKGFAQDIVHRIEQNGGHALAVQADVSKIAELQALAQATIDYFGHIDILVNNAGTMTTKPLEQVTEQDFEREFVINVKGTYFACQLAAKYLPERRGGVDHWTDPARQWRVHLKTPSTIELLSVLFERSERNRKHP